MTRTGSGRWHRPLRIAAELAIAFGLLAAVDRWLTGGTGLAAVQPNPLWIPVLVMALAYGTGPGLLAAGIASAIFLAHAHHNVGERDYLDHLFHLSLQPLLWSVAAVAIGEVTILRTTRHEQLARRGGIAKRNVARLTEAFATLSRTNRLLQVQIATETRTAGHAIAVATRLSSIDPADRRGAIGELIALASRTDDFTCYRIVGDGARSWLHGALTAGRREILPAALLERIDRRRAILHVANRGDRRVLEDVGVAAIALTDRQQQLVGCLILHTLPFEALNASRAAELGEIAEWLTPLLAETSWSIQRPARAAGLVA